MRIHGSDSKGKLTTKNWKTKSELLKKEIIENVPISEYYIKLLHKKSEKSEKNISEKYSSVKKISKS